MWFIQYTVVWLPFLFRQNCKTYKYPHLNNDFYTSWPLLLSFRADDISIPIWTLKKKSSRKTMIRILEVVLQLVGMSGFMHHDGQTLNSLGGERQVFMEKNCRKARINKCANGVFKAEDHILWSKVWNSVYKNVESVFSLLYTIVQFIYYT